MVMMILMIVMMISTWAGCVDFSLVARKLRAFRRLLVKLFTRCRVASGGGCGSDRYQRKSHFTLQAWSIKFPVFDAITFANYTLHNSPLKRGQNLVGLESFLEGNQGVCSQRGAGGRRRSRRRWRWTWSPACSLGCSPWWIGWCLPWWRGLNPWWNRGHSLGALVRAPWCRGRPGRFPASPGWGRRHTLPLQLTGFFGPTWQGIDIYCVNLRHLTNKGLQVAQTCQVLRRGKAQDDCL